MAGWQRGLKQVAAIKDHLVSQRQQAEVWCAEDLSFSHDGQAVCTLYGGEWVVDQLQIGAFTVNAVCLLHGHGVISLDLGSCGPQRLQQDAAGRFAHVVGVGVKAKPQTAMVFPLRSPL